MAWTRLGVRYRKVRSRGSWRGTGPKVHVESRDPVNKTWWPVCTNADPAVAFDLGWTTVPDNEEVTCKLCLRAEHAWRKRGT